MCPGRFPSPTPSPESSPVEATTNCDDVFATTPERRSGMDFTAPNSLRRRPRFAGVQSEPSISTARITTNVPLISTPTPISKRSGERRASDPPRPSSDARTGNGMMAQATNQGRRTVSNPMHLYTSPPLPDFHHPSSPEATDIELKDLLNSTLSSEDGPGRLYVISNRAQKGWGYKIGFTQRENYTKRIREHERCCGFTPYVAYTSKPVEYVKRVEALVHKDLEDFRKPRFCQPFKGSHREWFVVDERLAVETVKRWEAFMQTQHPYGYTRNLSYSWTYFIGQRRRAGPISNDDGHDARRERWTYIISSPTAFDRIRLGLHWSLWLCRMMLTVGSFTWRVLVAFRSECAAMCTMGVLNVFPRSQLVSALVAASVYICCKLGLSLPKKPRHKKTQRLV